MVHFKRLWILEKTFCQHRKLQSPQPLYFVMKKHKCIIGQVKLNFYYFIEVSKLAGVIAIKFSWLLSFQTVSVFFPSLALCLLHANMIPMTKSSQERYNTFFYALIKV